jgi:hypothetical protein
VDVAWLGQWPGAVLLQQSGTAYLFVNATHILGISLILGAILPLDLRLLGFFGPAPLPVLLPTLTKVAASGVALAVLTGIWLFSVQPTEYAGNAAFLWKMALLLLALTNVHFQHRSPHWRQVLQGAAIDLRVRARALASLLLWLGVLVAGRWIGFL